MKLVVCFFVVLSPLCIYSSTYDTAVNAAHHGEWKNAYEKLHTILVNEPDRADILYDTGVAAYNLGDVTQAATYFARAAEHAKIKDLQIQALFNAANASVAENRLAAALDQYEKVLALDAEHEYARHNRDRVKQMLEQQKKEQEKKNQQDKEQDKQEKEKQDNQQQDQQQNNDQDQSQDDQQGDQNNENQNEDGDQQQSQQDNKPQQNGQKNGSSGNKKSDKQSQDDKADEVDKGDTGAQGKEQGDDKHKEQKKAGDKQQRNGDEELDKKSDDRNGKGDNTQSDKHKNTPGNQGMTNDASSLPLQEEQGQAGEIDNPFFAKILHEQEENDKAMNKQLMSAKIRQHGGKNGQNCW